MATGSRKGHLNTDGCAIVKEPLGLGYHTRVSFLQPFLGFSVFSDVYKYKPFENQKTWAWWCTAPSYPGKCRQEEQKFKARPAVAVRVLGQLGLCDRLGGGWDGGRQNQCSPLSFTPFLKNFRS